MKKIAVLGPQGTNGHEVARNVMHVMCEDIVFCKRNEDILELCARGECAGVVPIENSSRGLVREAVDFWMSHMDLPLPFSVMGEAQIPIAHSLLVSSKCADVRSVRVVKSHPQALGQCSKIIAELGAQTAPTSSTAEAAREVSVDNLSDTAAIASSFAAEVYGLVVARTKIQDHSGNATRFHILGSETPGVTGNDRTAVIFELPNRRGTLASVLIPIGSLGANLSSIHSIPLGNPGVYAFYAEFDLHQDSAEGRKILACMRTLCNRVRVLGSYPQEKQ